MALQLTFWQPTDHTAWCTGGVAAILAALLRDGGAPKGLGPASCIAYGCAAVFSMELAEAVSSFTTSVIYG